MRSQIGEGLRYLLGHPVLRCVAGCTATSNYFSSMGQAVLLLYFVRVLALQRGCHRSRVHDRQHRLLRRRDRSRRGSSGRLKLGRTLWLSILVAQGGIFFIAFSPRHHAFGWIVAGLVLTTLGSPIYNIAQVSYRQAITPNNMLGRMNASMRFMVWGTMPLGSLTGGLLGTIFGLKTTLIIGAFGGMLAVLFVLTKPVRELVSVRVAARVACLSSRGCG